MSRLNPYVAAMFPIAIYAQYRLKKNEATRNIICSLFGHKLDEGKYHITIVNSIYIDPKTCHVYYLKDGFCSRCNEYVMYNYDAVMNHSMVHDYDRSYCRYGCGFEAVQVK